MYNIFNKEDEKKYTNNSKTKQLQKYLIKILRVGKIKNLTGIKG